MRAKNFNIRISEERYDAYRDASKVAGKTLSAWIRHQCDKALKLPSEAKRGVHTGLADLARGMGLTEAALQSYRRRGCPITNPFEIRAWMEDNTGGPGGSRAPFSRKDVMLDFGITRKQLFLFFREGCPKDDEAAARKWITQRLGLKRSRVTSQISALRKSLAALERITA